MRFRKPRIAWSVFWGGAAVLLIALWVRSYFWRDTCYVASRLQLQSFYGGMKVDVALPPYSFERDWYYGYQSTAEIVWRGDTFTAKRNLFLFHGGEFNEPYCFPHWAVELPLAMFSAAPWIWSGRFSLRTLLIAMTLVAVVLGLIVTVV